mmetsp:Transcript_38015/g.38699  ORF Transcript_38015/g.38699 Transcript_38015/m.38699 type:complete len:159 (+) Transcript_38015:583-1059(+)
MLKFPNPEKEGVEREEEEEEEDERDVAGVDQLNPEPGTDEEDDTEEEKVLEAGTLNLNPVMVALVEVEREEERVVEGTGWLNPLLKEKLDAVPVTETVLTGPPTPDPEVEKDVEGGAEIEGEEEEGGSASIEKLLFVRSPLGTVSSPYFFRISLANFT